MSCVTWPAFPLRALLQLNKVPVKHTVPNLSMVALINVCLHKTVITTVITADTQCRNVVTNCNYESDLRKFRPYFNSVR